LRQVPFGDEGQWPQSNLVRILHGQPADYLLASLKAYAEGKRLKRNHATIGGGSRPGGYA